MQVVDEKVFNFEGYTLDLRRGCLRRANREIALRPKSFAVLRYLVENAGRLVTKDELIGTVWKTIAVTDASLTRCVSDVRLALQDREQRIIRTAPRFISRAGPIRFAESYNSSSTRHWSISQIFLVITVFSDP